VKSAGAGEKSPAPSPFFYRYFRIRQVREHYQIGTIVFHVEQRIAITIIKLILLTDIGEKISSSGSLRLK
jgi:hypothetical protein